MVLYEITLYVFSLYVGMLIAKGYKLQKQYNALTSNRSLYTCTCIDVFAFIKQTNGIIFSYEKYTYS